MKKLLFIVCATVALAACEKKEPEATGTAPETSSAATTEEATSDETSAEDGNGAVGDQVTVASTGTTYDPPVAPERLPDGVWYCDMGTVHYARTAKGDGKCEVCSMALKQKGGAAAAAEDDDHGHDHGEDGQDHAH